MSEITSSHNSLAGEPERKRLLERPRYRWVNIKICLKERRCEVVEDILLARDMQQ
jgi:hypothetical protein